MTAVPVTFAMIPEPQPFVFEKYPDMMLKQRNRSTRRGRREGHGQEEGEGEQEITVMIEFSCPYGCVSHDRDTLEKTYKAKKSEV
jgi:hypothetical protein